MNMETVVSFRVPTQTHQDLHALAGRMGCSVSDLLRSSAESLTKPIGYFCPHVSVSIGQGWIVSVTSSCSCVMEPREAA